MYLFNGIESAQKRENILKKRITNDFSEKELKIAAILFVEDAGSRLYTKLKHEAADRVGILYETHQFSLKNNSQEDNIDRLVIEKIRELNQDPSVTGIIIQKPWRKTWAKANSGDKEQYSKWWTNLTSIISEEKDVDGLHPNTISQIKSGTWKENKKVLPATCRAVLTIIDRVEELKFFSPADDKVIIIGISDLLGRPLYYELLRRGGFLKTELIASNKFKERMTSGAKLLDAKLVVSATGRSNLITEDMVADNVVLIDVGEPGGDIDAKSVSQKASFLTPVPGGVGPMTVISLLENCVDLAG